jgi:hypothetical protein
MSKRITMAGMLKLELPAATVRLVDGGTLTVDGETYLARDPFIGVLSGFEALNEGVGDEAPAGSLTFLPPDATPAAALNTGASQGARLRLWTVDVDQDTGLVIGAPLQEADWIVDYPTMTIDIGQRELELAFVSGGDRFFQIDRGNALSPTFHRSVHPGEAGLDAASGAETSVPWGAPSQPRGTAVSSGGSAGGGGFNGGNVAYV